MTARLLSATFFVLLTAAAPARAQTAEIVSTQKIWDKAIWQGLTDLVRFQNLFYCAFREGESATKGEGAIHFLLSASGETWIDHVTLKEPGVDLRDPKLCVMADEKRIYLVCAGILPGGARQSRYATTTDGKVWTPFRPLLAKGDTLWRVMVNPADKRMYGVSHNIHPNSGGPAPEKEYSLKGYASDDGSVWQLSSILNVPGQPTETTLRFLKDGSALALVNREGGNRLGAIGAAKAPFREWTWTALKQPLGAPNFIELPDGRLIAGSRGFGATPGPHTVLYKMTPTSLDPLLELPSGGDCSHPGLWWHDGFLHVTYYSSHEAGKSAIYHAKVRIK
ncbi:MAG: exo-alpha-sialidase [Verrucomicrobiaceae bacterium]|nr:exo-alpha-sialidase [Verrucomicrobiaceae bacterium]